MVPWLGLCSSLQGAWVPSLVGEDTASHAGKKKKKKKKSELDPQVVVIQSLSHVKLFKTTWTAASKLGLISTAEGKSPSSLGREGLSSWYHTFLSASACPLLAWEWLGRLGRGVELYCPATGYTYPIKGETGCAYAYLNMEN